MEDRGAWCITFHEVAKSQTQLSDPTATTLSLGSKFQEGYNYCYCYYHSFYHHQKRLRDEIY